MATAAAAGGAGAGLTFSVSHFDDRFAFACERADPDAGGVAPAPFGLLWHHPLSVDPERFGFAAQPLTGADTYVAPRRTRVARVDAGDAESPRRCASNVVRVAEVAAQKRFSLHGVAPPALVGVLDAASALERPVLRTHLGGRPFAHGLQAGDVVQLARQPGPAAVADGEGGAERDAPEAPVAWPRGGAPCSCVVLAPLEGDEVHVLRLDAPRLAGLADAGACVQVACRAEPWNLCLGRPRSVPEHVLGFPRGAVQWGLDGSVEDAEGRRLPPFVAPHTHCLDHPDYVLMTLSESSGAALEHSYDGENRHVFCKLSLYPLFREERMLPRDTSLLRGNLSRFTLAFWNPDLRTPYRFHGAEFSLASALRAPSAAAEEARGAGAGGAWGEGEGWGEDRAATREQGGEGGGRGRARDLSRFWPPGASLPPRLRRRRRPLLPPCAETTRRRRPSLRVAEFGCHTAGPLVGRILAGFGARVVSVVRPARARGAAEERARMGPAFAELRHAAAEVVELDLPRERERALALVRASDVVVENFGPGVMERLGLGADACLIAAAAADARAASARAAGPSSTSRCRRPCPATPRRPPRSRPPRARPPSSRARASSPTWGSTAPSSASRRATPTCPSPPSTAPSSARPPRSPRPTAAAAARSSRRSPPPSPR